jgi:hypothetical protein
MAHAVRKRENTHNGGVALMVSPEWTVEEIDTQHEDIVCAQISCDSASRTYTIIGTYIPYSTDIQHSKDIMDGIQKL